MRKKSTISKISIVWCFSSRTDQFVTTFHLHEISMTLKYFVVCLLHEMLQPVAITLTESDEDESDEDKDSADEFEDDIWN